VSKTQPSLTEEDEFISTILKKSPEIEVDAKDEYASLNNKI